MLLWHYYNNIIVDFHEKIKFLVVIMTHRAHLLYTVQVVMQADTQMESEKDFDQHLYDLRREIMVS